MEKDFVYRLGTREDMRQMKQLGLISFGQYSDQLEPEQWIKMHGGLQDEKKFSELMERSTSFVCEHGERIIGMVYLIPRGNAWDIFKNEWSYIRMLGVHPEFSGRGIGKRLTALCIEQARKNEETTIALHTSELMPAARHIYESFGFKVLKEIEPRYGKKYWLYTLGLN